MGGALKKLPQAPARHEVGYSKPPAHSRFRPGQSGNPRGRPKGSRNRATVPGPREERLKAIILEEAYRPISVKDGNRQVTMPMAKAVLRSVAVNAAKGGQWAQRHFTELLSATERDKRREDEELIEAALHYKRSWYAELASCKKHGIEAPDPIPHPDDVVVNLRTGEVQINGPMTREEKAELERLRESIRESQSELAYFRQELAKTPGCQQWIDDIEDEEYILALKRFTEQVLTGADPDRLERPVRPPSVEQRAAKYKDRLQEWRRRRLNGPAAKVPRSP